MGNVTLSLSDVQPHVATQGTAGCGTEKEQSLCYAKLTVPLTTMLTIFNIHTYEWYLTSHRRIQNAVLN